MSRGDFTMLWLALIGAASQAKSEKSKKVARECGFDPDGAMLIVLMLALVMVIGLIVTIYQGVTGTYHSSKIDDDTQVVVNYELPEEEVQNVVEGFVILSD